MIFSSSTNIRKSAEVKLYERLLTDNDTAVERSISGLASSSSPPTLARSALRLSSGKAPGDGLSTYYLWLRRHAGF